MAKRKPKKIEDSIAIINGVTDVTDPVLMDEELLGVTMGDIVEALEKNDKKKFYGYHPITGDEVWL